MGREHNVPINTLQVVLETSLSGLSAYTVSDYEAC